MNILLLTPVSCYRIPETRSNGACYRTPLRQKVLFLMLLKRIQLPTFSNDLFARDQNHEKKHLLPSSIASVFQVSCSMAMEIGGQCFFMVLSAVRYVIAQCLQLTGVKGMRKSAICMEPSV